MQSDTPLTASRRTSSISRRVVNAFSLVVLVGSSTIVPSARAAVPTPEVLDVSLLRAGAIIVARVSAITVPSDRSDLAELHLSDASVVANRFAQVPPRLRLRATVDGSGGGATAMSREVGTFQAGRRYIFFLHSGTWRDNPFESGPESVYGVDASTGYVTCDNGHVLGLDPTGVVCGVVDPAIIAPLTEREFVGRLGKEYTRAQARRPALAARLRALTHSFFLNPNR
jgi:hypothetical protein